MAVEKPSLEEIRELAAELGLNLDADDAAAYAALVEGNLGALAVLDELPEAAGPPPAPRPSQRPADADNPLGAWAVRTDVRGAPDGPLAGRSVVLKDNVMLAGVPLSNGTSILDEYVPPVDATIVTRILEAGGHVVGKSVCEAYCFSGGSHTSASGPVRNPHDPARSAGGSSSGSGALVASGEVDLAIGCDQGGSIRVPASFCGIYGMKPTCGLVPYTGILGLDPTIDHAGPMTADVRDNALLLEVIAGPDGLDTRQYAPRPEPYTEALGAGIARVRIGLLGEGFANGPGADPAVDEKVRAAARHLQKLGAQVTEVSVPLHRAGPAIGFARLQAPIELVFHGDGLPLGRQDPAELGYLRAQRAWRDRADELPANLKVFLITSAFLKRRFGYQYVARSESQVRRLRAAYDAALRGVDLLLLPTTPMKAPLLPAADAPPAAVVEAALAPLTNTISFDNTHHPAMSVPCGASEGLPVGMMLVGRHFEESTIYRVAHAFEQHEDWRSL